MKADLAAREHLQEPRCFDLRRVAFLVLGCVMLLLGLIGAFLPLMPTTIFLILAAWFFDRSSPRLEAWMLAHPRFGPVLRNWREHGAMPRRAKWLACTGMAIGYGLFVISAHPGAWLAVGAAVLIGGCAIWLVSLPEPTSHAGEPMSNRRGPR